MDVILLHGNLLTPNGILEDGAILMRDGKIAAIQKSKDLPITAGAEITDAQGLFVSPGLIDTHTHGGVGFDFMTCSHPELNDILTWLPTTGVTSVLPTLSSSPFDQTLDTVVRLAEAQHRLSPGAAILGLHLEGPYLNPDKRGAQSLDSIRLPDRVEMQRLIVASGGAIRLVTLAPELAGAMDLIRYLIGEGIAVSAGHTNAGYEGMVKASQVGLSRVAHLYNGMAAFHHREPGIVGATFDLESIFVELILDGIHVHPAAARLALRAKGLNRIILITDATQAAGLGDGEYIRPGNRKIIVKDGSAQLESGVIAGSTLTMNRAVANAVKFLGLSLDQAVQIASRTVAESLNLSTKGSLAPGYDADVILIDDDVRVLAAFVAGRQVFQYLS